MPWHNVVLLSLEIVFSPKIPHSRIILLSLRELCHIDKLSLTTENLTKFTDGFHLLILLCLGLIIAGPGYQSLLVCLEEYWALLFISLPSSCIIEPHQRPSIILIVPSVALTPPKINFEL